MYRSLFTIIFLFFSLNHVFSQQINQKCIYVFSGEVVADSLTLIPGSIQLNDTRQGSYFTILDDGKSLQITTDKDSVQVCYQTLPFDLNKSFFNRSLSVYDSQAIFKDPPREKTSFEVASLIQKDELMHEGAITRGVTVGNQQSLTMQSRMNLQLEGKLNNDLQVSAQITDQQVPYLPEGNSQYLRDYDHVSVKLFNDKFSLEAGDQLWKLDHSYFGRYSRNVEGARLQFFRNNEKGRSITSIGAASARGKFTREQLEVQDGVSGPYRIPRPTASLSVVILPGSEKVYIDGQELLRGYDNDYVIDYNQGEITFTNKILITRYSRVIVEFEYTQLAYQQSSLMADHQYFSDKANVFIHYYRQHDNAQQPVGIDLNASDMHILANESPVEGVIYLPGVDSIGYQSSQPMYAKRDTVVDGRFHSYFYYSNDQERAHYRLSFRESETGNYIIRNYTAEGKIYQWIAPVNGTPQGNYEPMIAVNPPETRQMLSLGGSIKTGKYNKIGLEYTSSKYDGNNLNENSSKAGGAFRIYHQGEEMPLSFLKDYELSHLIEFQWVNRHFKPLERYRSVEFDRFWLQNDSVKSDELLMNGEIKLERSSNEYFEYNINKRVKDGTDGWFHQIDIREKWKNLQGNADITLVNSKNSDLSSNWLNYNIGMSYKLGEWTPGVRVIAEENKILISDSLFASKNSFIERQAYVNHLKAGKQDFGILYAVREDQLPNDGEFRDFSKSHTITTTGNIKSFDLRMNYRHLTYEDASDAEESLSGDITWKGSVLNKLVRQEISYGVSQGRELRRSFQYLQVMPGEGTHTWRDLNNNGVKDLDEFFEAINIDERNYIKILVPTDDFIPAYESRLSYRGDYQLPEDWSNSKGLKYYLSRVMGNFVYQSTRKTSSNDWQERLWIFGEQLEDSLLVSDRTMMNGRLFLKRTRENFGGGIGYRQLKRKEWFQAGFQHMERQEWNFDMIYSITPSLDITFEGAEIEESMEAGFSEKASYRVKGWFLQPELSYNIANQWQISGGYRWQDKESFQYSDGYAYHREFQINLKYNRQNTFISTDFRLTNIDFQGEENTATGYALLEAMRPGQNLYWQFNIQHKLSNGLRVSAFYDGRKSEENDPVHLGRIQVTAFF